MQPTPSVNQFENFNSSYRLKGKLFENKLFLQLVDCESGCVYEREYGEEDIGKQIHVVMDLSYLIENLSFNKSSDDKVESHKLFRLGQVVKNGELPCYKIQKQGLVVVYMLVHIQNTNRHMIYESRLQLQKIRVLSQTEKLLDKINQQQTTIKQMQMEHKKEKQDFKREIKQLNDRIQNLCSQMHAFKGQLKIPSNKFYFGQTSSWVGYNAEGAYVKIDYSQFQFSKTPEILTTIHGSKSIWTLRGMSSIYNADNKGCTIYIHGLNEAQLKQYKVILRYVLLVRE